MAFLELVDTYVINQIFILMTIKHQYYSENEVFPARPVGREKLQYVLDLMKMNRRNYRKYYNVFLI